MAFEIKAELHSTKNAHYSRRGNAFSFCAFLSSAEMNTALEKSERALCTRLKGVNERTEMKSCRRRQRVHEARLGLLG